MTSPPGTPADARRRAVARLLVMLVGGLLLLAPVAGNAFAHAQLVRTSPVDGAVLATAPQQAELEFSETVDLIDGAVRLFPTDGAPIQLDAVARDGLVTVPLPEPLADGVYVLDYRVISADGHPVGGALSFRVGKGQPPAPAPDASITPGAIDGLVDLLTGLQYLGLLVFAGTLVFHSLVLRPARPAPPKLARWSLGIGTVSSLLLVAAGALRAVGAQPWEVVRPGTWVGAVEWPTVAVPAIGVVLGGSALLLSRHSSEPAVDDPSRLRAPLGPQGPSMRQPVAAVVAVLVLVGPVLVGHTRSTQPVWLMMTADFGHLLAAAIWLGGLLGLGRELTRVRRLAGPSRDSAMGDLARTVARFSTFALGSVCLLAISGLIMGSLILGNPTALVSTGYGRTLLLKLGIVVPVLAIAGWNRYRLVPGVMRGQGGAGGWDALARTLRNEAALLIAVLAVTGVLVNGDPHASSEPGPSAGGSRTDSVPVSASSQGLDIVGTVAPGQVGSNRLRLTLTYRGEPVTTGEVTVAARLPAEDLGPLPAAIVPDPATGEYTATVTLPASGAWQLQVSARIDTFTKPVALIELTIP